MRVTLILPGQKFNFLITHVEHLTEYNVSDLLAETQENLLKSDSGSEMILNKFDYDFNFSFVYSVGLFFDCSKQKSYKENANTSV